MTSFHDPEGYDARDRQRRLEIARLEGIATALLPRALGGDVAAAKLVAQVEERKAMILSPDLVPRGELRRWFLADRKRTKERIDEVLSVVSAELHVGISPEKAEAFRKSLGLALADLEKRWKLEDEEVEAGLEEIRP